MPPPKVVGRRGRGILQGNQKGFNVFEGKRRNDYKLFYDQLVLVGRQQIPVFFKTIRVIHRDFADGRRRDEGREPMDVVRMLSSLHETQACALWPATGSPRIAAIA